MLNLDLYMLLVKVLIGTLYAYGSGHIIGHCILFASALVYLVFRNTIILDLNTSFKLNYINTCKSFEYLMKANRTGKVFCCPGPIGYSVTSDRIVPGRFYKSITLSSGKQVFIHGQCIN